MLFTRLTFLAAFFIEGLASIVSIIGISALFGNNLIIMSLVAALDVGKILVVSLLYSHWSKLPTLMRAYALVAAAITMIITSAGTAGYLSSAFQQAVIGTQEGALKVSVLKEQQKKYEERKKQIDDQIANLTDKTSVNQRLRLMNGFQQEQERLDSQILEIDKTLPSLQITQISSEAKAGPILFIAKAFEISPEEAIKWIILLIVFVFDPLAVFLVVSGNFLFATRKKELESVKNDSPVETLPKIESITAMTDNVEEIKPVKIKPVKIKAPRKPRTKKVKPTVELTSVVDPVIPLEDFIGPQKAPDFSPEDHKKIEPILEAETATTIVGEITETKIDTKDDTSEVETKTDTKDMVLKADDASNIIHEKPVKVPAEELAKAVWGNIPKPNIGREEITKKSLGLPRRRQNIIV